MTCQACQKAESDPGTGEFMMRCNECRTRQLAHGIDFWDRRLQPDAYKIELAKIARDGEKLEQAHARVKAWADLIAQSRVE